MTHHSLRQSSGRFWRQNFLAHFSTCSSGSTFRGHMRQQAASKREKFKVAGMIFPTSANPAYSDNPVYTAHYRNCPRPATITNIFSVQGNWRAHPFCTNATALCCALLPLGSITGSQSVEPSFLSACSLWFAVHGINTDERTHMKRTLFAHRFISSLRVSLGRSYCAGIPTKVHCWAFSCTGPPGRRAWRPRWIREIALGGAAGRSSMALSPFLACSCRDRPQGQSSINSREPSVPCDAIPKVDCKTDVTGPKRISTAASNHLSAAILEDGSHGELARAVEPSQIICASVELEDA